MPVLVAGKGLRRVSLAAAFAVAGLLAAAANSHPAAAQTYWDRHGPPGTHLGYAWHHPGYDWRHRGYAWQHRGYAWNHRGYAWNHRGWAWRHR